jgi:hypothetical protein
MHGLGRMLRAALLVGAFLVVPFREGNAAPVARESDLPQGQSKGRPVVKLDSLVLPSQLDGLRVIERHLRSVLRREVRRVDWGAGRGNKIEYRFYVDELEVMREGDVVRVRCRATGKLPGGRTARSSLSFGGDPAKQQDVIKRVLEIVARGVITRLAQLERQRRTGSR